MKLILTRIPPKFSDMLKSIELRLWKLSRMMLVMTRRLIGLSVEKVRIIRNYGISLGSLRIKAILIFPLGNSTSRFTGSHNHIKGPDLSLERTLNEG